MIAIGKSVLKCMDSFCGTLLRIITCKASSAELCCEQSLAKRPLRNFAANNHLQSVLCGTLLRTITCKARGIDNVTDEIILWFYSDISVLLRLIDARYFYRVYIVRATESAR